MSEPYVVRAEVCDRHGPDAGITRVREWTRDNHDSALRLHSALIMHEGDEDQRAPYDVTKVLGLWHRSPDGREEQIR